VVQSQRWPILRCSGNREDHALSTTERVEDKCATYTLSLMGGTNDQHPDLDLIGLIVRAQACHA
jgi:hypothetical protein